MENIKLEKSYYTLPKTYDRFMNLKRVRIQMYELSKQNSGGKTNWYLLVIEKNLLLKFYIKKIFYPME